MGPTARTHYPRQCKNQTPVQIEKTRTSIKWSNRVPRKLTERRKNLIREFLQTFLEKSHLYAAYGTEPWIDSLLHYMNERPSYGLAPVDVKIWMGNEMFFNTEVISILCRHARHGNHRVGIQRERVRETCDAPAVQPHPNHRFHTITTTIHYNHTLFQLRSSQLSETLFLVRSCQMSRSMEWRQK